LFVINLLKIALYLVCIMPGIVIMMAWFFYVMAQAGAQGPAFQTVRSGGGQPVVVRSAPPPAPDFTLLLVALAVMLIGLVPFVFFYVRLFLFTPWFVIDRGCGPIESIKGNWNLTQGHSLGWLGITILLSLIYGVAAMPCYLGIPFALPIYYLVLNAAWMRITRPQITEGPL
jgi:hypothetical protein